MPTNTSRLALTVPVTTDPPLIPANFLTLADQLDALAAVYYQGTAANRSTVVPTPVSGTFYFATDTGAVSYHNGTSWIVVGPGALLGSHQYAPSSPGGGTINTSSLTAIDTTNIITPAFVAPPSGNVLIRTTYQLSASSSIGVEIAWFLHGTTTQIGFTWGFNLPGLGNWPCSMEQEITGLTPGNSYQFDLAAKASASATFECQGNTGAASGMPFTVSVTSV